MNVTTGANLVLIGQNCGDEITTGEHNTGIGSGCLGNITDSSYNLAIGAFALRHASGDNNVGIGRLSMRAPNNSGVANNVAIGVESVSDASFEGQDNLFLGYRAGYAATDSDGNLLLGFQSGDNITTGDYNLIIGYDLDAPSATASYQMNIGGVIGGFTSGASAPGLTLTVAPIPGTDLTASGLKGSVTVDTNAVGVGAALYLASDGNYDEADADAASTMPCTAVALETGTGTKTVLFNGFIRDDSWAWTPGGNIYVSTTQGTFTQTAPSGSGDQVQVVGIAQSADVIYFNPSLDVFEVA